MGELLEAFVAGVKGVETGVGAVQHVARGVAKEVKPVAPYKPGYQAQEARAIQVAAQKWHINPVLLWGVYGAETAHGSDIKTSSAGARGPFQFLPSTAREYGYPLGVNENGVTNMKAFSAQADAAARYLASLLPGGKGELGLKPGPTWSAAWNKALLAYSGGGYGLAHVREEGSSYGGATGYKVEREDEEERAKIEQNPWSPESGTWGKLAELGLTLILVLAGALLLIYGVAVAVRPRESALSRPSIPWLGFA